MENGSEQVQVVDGGPDADAGDRASGLLYIAGGVGVFIVCSIIQSMADTSMFETSFVEPDSLLLELLIQVTFLPGWLATVGLLGSGVLMLLGGDE